MGYRNQNPSRTTPRIFIGLFSPLAIIVRAIQSDALPSASPADRDLAGLLRNGNASPRRYRPVTLSRMKYARLGCSLALFVPLCAVLFAWGYDGGVFWLRLAIGGVIGAFFGLLFGGPMVLGVCQRILGNKDGAEDSFQATFLVLAQRASSIRKHDSMASWLYGVAQRIASRARHKAAVYAMAPLNREKRSAAGA
jgi:hypothetical protein